MSRKSKNFVVKNGYTFGSLLAERLYRRERFLNGKHSLSKQFAAWVKVFGVSKELVSGAPRLINCQASVNRFFRSTLTFSRHV